MANIDPWFDAIWPSPTTPDQHYLAAKIRCGDLDGARSFVENMSDESRQKITENSSLMLTALEENKAGFIRFLVEKCNVELEKSVNKPAAESSKDEIFRCFLILLRSNEDTSITPLRYAARFKKTEAAVELMRLGAHVNAVSPNSRRTALHDACKFGTLDIVRHLIQHGADLTKRDIRGKTALMCGVDHVDVCRELIVSGADVNATNILGNTALHDAVDNDRQNPEVVKLLLENGADLFKRNKNGYDALYLACRNRVTDIVKVMRDQCSGDEVGQKTLMRSHQLLGACYIEYNDPFGGLSHVNQALAEWETAIRLREEMRHVIIGEDNVVSTPNSSYDNEVEIVSMVKFDQMRQDANKIFMQGLILKEKILGPTHFETLKSLTNLTKYYIRSEDYGRSLRLLRHTSKQLRDERVYSFTRNMFLDDLRLNSGRVIDGLNKRAIKDTVDFKDVYEFLEAIADEGRRSVEPTTDNNILMQMTLFLIKLFFQIEANEINIVEFRRMVRDFVRLNVRSSHGRTVLMKAVCPQNCDWFSSDVDAIKLLLECGADTWETDNYGNSVLHLLANSEIWITGATGNARRKEAKKKVAEMLLAFGAHFDARNNAGFSAVDYLSSLGLEFSTHMTLQCFAAQAIRRRKLPYAGILPKSLVEFVKMH